MKQTTQTAQNTNVAYGKIEGNALLYKGKYYAIVLVGDGVLFLDTDKLFGKVGDEFPLSLVR
jgi:hypothetical protein